MYVGMCALYVCINGEACMHTEVKREAQILHIRVRGLCRTSGLLTGCGNLAPSRHDCAANTLNCGVVCPALLLVFKLLDLLIISKVLELVLKMFWK